MALKSKYSYVCIIIQNHLNTTSETRNLPVLALNVGHLIVATFTKISSNYFERYKLRFIYIQLKVKLLHSNSLFITYDKVMKLPYI